ncbi:hypothetical protein GUJ93_ZPchr0014g47275 [Zizania palustris]|uniref:Uncharacterized protein n=1 Tax=Zizania palustris TaxID=103762 RepID=A0A8J5W5P4_ZIZPA|nr:hypothetical protein GUJ93_ZPchr0014g47275 [Zizania palustris]
MHHLLAPSCSPTKGGPPPPQCPSSSGLWSPGLLQNSSQVVSDRSPEELKMGSIERQESFDDNGDLINLADDIVVVEAPTLTSEEMDRARREALEVLRNNTPEEALRIFTQLQSLGSSARSVGTKSSLASDAWQENVRRRRAQNRPASPEELKAIDRPAGRTLDREDI